MTQPSAIHHRLSQLAALSCPICHQPLSPSHHALLCSLGHCYNLSKKGVLYTLSSPYSSPHYTKDFFTHRHHFLSKGYYNHILQGVREVLSTYLLSGNLILDTGCGEGYYLKQLENTFSTIGLDISKEAIDLASKGPQKTLWVVGDLTRLPFRNHTIHCILNLFSPAHYQEFSRVLRPGGYCLKVLPHSSHLQELKALLPSVLEDNPHSSLPQEESLIQDASSLSRFHHQGEVVFQQTYTKTYPLPPEDLVSCLNMTPFLFHKTIPTNQLKEITISGTLVLLKFPERDIH